MKHIKVAISITESFLCFCITALSLFISAKAQYEAQPASTYFVSYCSEYSHYDQGSEFQSNLDVLKSNLTSKAKTLKFSHITLGTGPDKVYGLFSCNSFLSNQSCQDCVATAAAETQQRCSFSKEYVAWYYGCMLRFSYNPIYSIYYDSLYYIRLDPPTDYMQFSQSLSKTFISLFSNVSTGNLSVPAAQKIGDVVEKISLFSYADCTPDLNQTDCRKCLNTALNRLPMLGAKDGYLVQPNCRLMYLFNDTRPPSPGFPVTAKAPRKLYIVALGIISAIAAASLLLNVCDCFRRRKGVVKPTGLDDVESMDNLHFEFDSIKVATSNFSSENELGRGGFGVVYKGTLADGQAIAVKRLSNASHQGMREFKTEACLAAKLQHRNLVKVYGFCLEREEMLLVYEFVPNKSLDRFLFDEKRGQFLNWETSFKIIVGIARGLLYLHEDSHPKIIHRDLKPSNILLDAKINPKIADFGLAKTMFGGDQSQGDTSRVAGTFGYMAPEYVIRGHFSNKSDMYSYGVIILEIINGTRNRCTDLEEQDENLLKYAWRLWNEGAQLDLVDSKLEGNFQAAEVERCIQVGLMCIQEDPVERPSAAAALRMLHLEPVAVLQPAPPPSFPYTQRKPEVSNGSYIRLENDSMASHLSPR